MSAAVAMADLVLVLGTSLSGLTADQVATAAAARSRQGRALGTVIVNLQQTARDGEATLRLFAETDTVLPAVVAALGLEVGAGGVPRPALSAVVPYGRDGRRSRRVRMVLDLSLASRLRLHPDHNCQGSRQPKLLHVYGRSGGAEPWQVVCRPPGPGEGTVQQYDAALSGWELTIEGVTLLLGGWWLEAAARGRLDTLPVINLSPSLGLQGEAGLVMLAEVEGEAREALEAEVLAEEAKDLEEEAAKDYSGLIPEAFQAAAGVLLGEMEQEGHALEELLESTRRGLESRLGTARALMEGGNCAAGEEGFVGAVKQALDGDHSNTEHNIE
jgi:hypothetical protein